jgi:hypothetical protein
MFERSVLLCYVMVSTFLLLCSHSLYTTASLLFVFLGLHVPGFGSHREMIRKKDTVVYRPC